MKSFLATAIPIPASDVPLLEVGNNLHSAINLHYEKRRFGKMPWSHDCVV